MYKFIKNLIKSNKSFHFSLINIKIPIESILPVQWIFFIVFITKFKCKIKALKQYIQQNIILNKMAYLIKGERIQSESSEKNKTQELLQRQLSLLKREFLQRQDQFKFQIRQLKKMLLEKETVENIVNNRVEKVRRQKDQQISRLSQLIEDQKSERNNLLEQKNEENNRLKEKFQKMINFELQNLKRNLQDQGEVFSIELNGLKEIISIKNDEITKLLTEIKRQAVDHEQDRKSLLSDIGRYKEKIYEIERLAELELYNLRTKLIQIHAADIKALEARYDELMETLRTDKNDLEAYNKEKDRLRQQERKDHQRNIHELNDKIKQREQRITNLLDRLKESGDLNTGELKNLHQSFHKITSEKESLTSQYSTNIQFMQQQISKLTHSNQIKNAELKRLMEELHETKVKFQSDLKQIQQKNRQDRKERDEERQRDRKQRQKMTQNMATLERQFKNNQKRLLREKEKEERQKNKLKFIVEELERDIQRLNLYIRSLDENLKNEFKRNQLGILQGDGSKRQITSQLNKQKVEIQTLKSIELDQIKRKFQIDTNRIIQENEKIKTELLKKSIALEKAEAQVKKLDYQHRNMQKINKENLFDYQKKMATLNNQINLTQQLYKTFMEAKARKAK